MKTCPFLICLALITSFIVFSSCEKEEYQPTHLVRSTDTAFTNGESFQDAPNYGDAQPAQAIDLVEMKAYQCPEDGGFTLFPYNPEFHNIFVYTNSDEYQVQWLIDGIYETDEPKLDCVCGDSFKVKVFRGAELIGDAFYSAPCE